MMDTFELQRLRDLPIEGVAERVGLEVARHKALCPFHNDHHASLSFNAKKNTYRCFVCGEHGGTIDLAMRCLHMDFKEACCWLGGEGNVIRYETKTKTKTEAKPFDASRYARFFERPFINQAAGQFLFEKRRLDPRVVRWCRLSSWQNWLQIPYFDIDGHLTGVQWRNLEVDGLRLKVDGQDTTNHTPYTINHTPYTIHQPRFRFPYGSQCGIYNLPVLNRLREGDELYITEGCSDCWAMLSAGHKAIAIPSATLLKPHDLEVLSSLSSSLSLSLHMYPDNDEPGERLFLQLKNLLPTLEHHQLPKGCKDFSDYYVKFKGG